MRAEEQGCRSGRRRGSIDERLAANDQRRREHRDRLQRELAAKYAA